MTVKDSKQEKIFKELKDVEILLNRMKHWNWGFIPATKIMCHGFCVQILNLSVAVAHLKGDAIGTTMSFHPGGAWGGGCFLA